MEVIGALVMVVAAFGIALARGGRKGRPDDHSRWRAIAQACGLSEVRPDARELSGRLGDLDVRLALGRGGVGAVVAVRGLAKTVGMARESLATRIDKALGGELQTGDDAFDRAFFLRGDPRVLLALLDAWTRETFVSACSTVGAYGAPIAMELAGGELRVTFPSEPEAAEVRTILLLAQRLREPVDPVGSLVANLEREPLPSVRRAILEALERSETTRRETRTAMTRAARQDSDPALRLRAALWLGRDGRPFLQELAEDDSVPDGVSESAIEELGPLVSLEQARRIVERSLPVGRTFTAGAAVNVLGAGGAGEVGFLAAVMERAVLLAAREVLIAAAWEELAVAAARALGRTGAASAEGPLAGALATKRVGLQLAAAAALGQVGTAASVGPLKELARNAPGLVQTAALSAVAHIRRRLTGVDPGHLALVDGPDGQLALAEDEHGRVSLPKDPD